MSETKTDDAKLAEIRARAEAAIKLLPLPLYAVCEESNVDEFDSGTRWVALSRYEDDSADAIAFSEDTDGRFPQQENFRKFNALATLVNVVPTLLSHLAAAQGRANSVDNPDCDGTDGAHPAWWRGYDHGSAGMIREVEKILNGQDDGQGQCNEPWESVRRRLIELVAAQERVGGERNNGIACVKHTDSVKIETPIGLHVQIPAWMILAADKVLRYMLLNTESLSMDPAEDESSCGWECALDAADETAFGDTPWGALVAMSQLIQSKEEPSA